MGAAEKIVLQSIEDQKNKEFKIAVYDTTDDKPNNDQVQPENAEVQQKDTEVLPPEIEIQNNTRPDKKKHSYVIKEKHFEPYKKSMFDSVMTHNTNVNEQKQKEEQEKQEKL